MNENKTKRMHQPLDSLIKRQNSYIGDVFHKYHGLPGTYLKPLPQEYPNKDGIKKKIDMGYFIELDGKKFIINNEDESKEITIDTLLKCDTYKVLLEYGFETPVINSITTIAPIEKCERILEKSMTQKLIPIIISYKTENPEKILSTITNKIESGETLSKTEALELIMLPKRFASDHREVLNKVCHLLKILKVEDEKFKWELIYEMKCIIHKYAETIDEIEEFEKVIGLAEAMTAMEYHEKSLIKQGHKNGLKEGLESEFKLALKIKHEFGLQKAASMSQFSIEELKNEKIDENRFKSD